MGPVTVFWDESLRISIMLTSRAVSLNANRAMHMVSHLVTSCVSSLPICWVVGEWPDESVGANK